MEILGIILLVIFILGLAVTLVIRKTLRRWSNTLFGTNTFREGWRQQEEQLSNTPKSISSMTKVYLPMILRDFPEFNLHEFSQRAENMLKSVFNAIEKQNSHLIVNASDDLRDQVTSYIRDHESQGIIERYDNVRIHQTEIHKYQKQAGTCLIVFQMAIEYYRYRLKGDQVISGRRDLKIQTKYNINLVYIQDVNKVKEAGFRNALGLTCPHCGGPVTNLGQKKCEYCGGGIKEINIHTWLLNKYEEL